jgi:hypothetical protein
MYREWEKLDVVSKAAEPLDPEAYETGRREWLHIASGVGAVFDCRPRQNSCTRALVCGGAGGAGSVRRGTMVRDACPRLGCRKMERLRASSRLAENRLLAVPYGRAEGFADADADADRDADDKHGDKDLSNHAVPLAQVTEAAAVAAVHLGRLGLSPPVVLAGPYLAVRVAAACVLSRLARGRRCAVLSGRDDGFDICVEWVWVVRGRRR